MGLSRELLFLALVVQSYAAPQLITFKDGRLGVNFGGYHAGVGIGGGAGSGAAGGLFAEAGTPHGQAARAGLGGAVDGGGKSAGGLFAGATAGGNVRASTGLGGAAGAEQTAGAGYASASAGNREAASGLGGQASGSGSYGFEFSGTKSYGVPNVVIKETEVSAVPVEKHEHKLHTELKLDNEIKHSETPNVEAHVEVKAVAPVAVAKEVFVEPQPAFVEKTIVHTHYKPSHHHHKTYIGGYIGGEAHAPPPPPPPPAQKRVDVGFVNTGHVEAGSGISESAEHGNGGQVTYKKEVFVEKNPQFFRDIFNIPISTLQAVGNLLTNTAAGTSIKVEKSASVGAGGYGQAGYGQAGYGQAGYGLAGGSSYNPGYGQVEIVPKEIGRVQLEKDLQVGSQASAYGQANDGFANFAKSFQFGGYGQLNHGY